MWSSDSTSVLLRDYLFLTFLMFKSYLKSLLPAVQRSSMPSTLPTLAVTPANVRLFPKDELRKAERYWEKSGTSPKF
jgi:hypothetical protein